MPWFSFGLHFMRKRNVWMQKEAQELGTISPQEWQGGSTRAAWVVSGPGEAPGQRDATCGCWL